jgi:ubiquinone/menaquinone biosynthesis C-methylase UbiE
LSSADPSGQQEYWGANLDPRNLGTHRGSLRAGILGEREFHFTPDRQDALAELRPLAGKRVLEVGAGVGYNALHLASEGATVVAIDISAERLAALKSVGAGERLWCVKCAAEALPFRGEVFDAACSKSVLIHTRIAESSAEVARTLVPDGIAVFIEPMTRNPFANLYRATLAPPEWKRFTRYFSEREIGEAVSGFQDYQARYYYFLSFLAFAWQFGVRVPALFRFSLALLNGLDRLLFAAFPSLRRLAWFVMIVARKR